MDNFPNLHWWSSPRTLLRTILMLDDTPHAVALGTAIGMFIGLTPTVGIQMILVVVFSLLTRRIFGFSRVAALITVYISNPLTVAPIYWFNYQVGTLFLPGNVTREAFAEILHYRGFSEWWDAIVTLFVDVGGPLIVGSLVIASIVGVLTYPVMRWLLHSLGHGESRWRNTPEIPAVPVSSSAVTEP